MSHTTRVRIISQPLLDSLTRPQAIMSCDTRALYAAAAAIAAGVTLTGTQASALETVWQVLGGSAPARVTAGLAAEDRAQLARSVTALADAAATEQRRLVAATIANTLEAKDWTVTVVHGGSPDHYTGIEATRSSEHLIVGVGPGELIADQSGARDGQATIDMIITGLREIGWTAMIAGDTPGEGSSDGSGGSLYVLPGGPTRAHAIQASLRYDIHRPGAAEQGHAPAGLRITMS